MLNKSRLISFVTASVVLCGAVCLFGVSLLGQSGTAPASQSGSGKSGTGGGNSGSGSAAGSAADNGFVGPVETPLPAATGTVLFQRGDAPADSAPTGAGRAAPKLMQRSGEVAPAAADTNAADFGTAKLGTDAEREAVLITKYGLDVRLEPAQNSIAVRARLVVKNAGAGPLGEIPLQISSSLNFESVREQRARNREQGTGEVNGNGRGTASAELDGRGFVDSHVSESRHGAPRFLLVEDSEERFARGANHPTLHDEAVKNGAPGVSAVETLKFKQQVFGSDVDHTGRVREAVIALSKPLAAGAEITLDVIYSGTIAQDATRLTRIGTPTDEAAESDWDQVSSGFVGLRGFGNVVWYPVAAKAAALGDGARVFEEVGRMNEREQGAVVGMTVSVEFVGDAPNLAVLDGEIEGAGNREQGTGDVNVDGNGNGRSSAEADPSASLRDDNQKINKGQSSEINKGQSNGNGNGQSSGQTAGVSSSDDKPAASGNRPGAVVPQGADAAETQMPVDPEMAVPHVVTFTLLPRRLGFGGLSLFVARRVLTTGDGMDVYSLPEHEATAQGYTAAATLVQPMFQEWFQSGLSGTTGASAKMTVPLTVVELPSTGVGDAAQLLQPFESGAVTFAGLRSALPGDLADEMVHPLAHGWFVSGRPWLSEGFAEFAETMWLERAAGKDLAIQRLDAHRTALALVESNDAGGAGQSLIEARDDVYYRTKAAYVWLMLREMVGQEALAGAMDKYRAGEDLGQGYFEGLVEAASGKDLKWFFDDWVYSDAGLPDLRIVTVTPKQELEGTSTGPGTYVVAVDVANDGGAGCEVPVVVRAANGVSSTQRVRVPARGDVTVRLVIAGKPESVLVGDGSVPEVRVGVHERDLK